MARTRKPHTDKTKDLHGIPTRDPLAHFDALGFGVPGVLLACWLVIPPIARHRELKVAAVCAYVCVVCVSLSYVVIISFASLNSPGNYLKIKVNKAVITSESRRQAGRIIPLNSFNHTEIQHGTSARYLYKQIN